MSNLIPEIDISKLLKYGFNSKRSLKTVKKIEKACLEIGFFSIKGHGLQQEINSTLFVCKKIFEAAVRGCK